MFIRNLICPLFLFLNLKSKFCCYNLSTFPSHVPLHFSVLFVNRSKTQHSILLSNGKHLMLKATLFDTSEIGF